MSNSKREKMVSSLSNHLRSLARKRSTSVVTADDAHNYLSKNGFVRNPIARLSVINSVLRTPTFEAVGSTASTREAAKGRMITEWSIA